MDPDEAKELFDALSSLDCVTNAVIFTPTDQYNTKEGGNRRAYSYTPATEDGEWYVEFDTVLPAGYHWYELPHELLQFLANRDLRLRRDQNTNSWEARPVETEETEECASAALST